MSYVNLLEIDPDSIFIEYNIKDIQEIDKRIQTEIEKKRQELRCMVGERYRDVLTAADTIQCMQQSADTFKTHIHKINKKCVCIQSSTQEDRPTIESANKSKDFLRSVAIQIKILILIPEIIWTCLDVADYLKAVQIYLFAIHIHTGLEFDVEHRVLEKFPILSRLKLSINLFKNRILEGIKKTLKEVKLKPQEAADHLCAYILLENKTQADALTFLIQLRHESLLELVHSEVTLHSAIRSRVLQLMHCLMCSIDLLTSCFVSKDTITPIKPHPADPHHLVKTSLEYALGKTGDGIIDMLELEGTSLLQHVPPLVRGYGGTRTRGRIDDELMQDTLVSALHDWLETTRHSLRTHLAQSLRHVTSVKVLHNIRQEITNIAPPDHWNQECLDIYLAKDLNVWKYFIQPLVSKRAEDLVRHKIKSSLVVMLEKVTGYLEACGQGDGDLWRLVWQDATDDVAMKTRGFSPQVVELCRMLDNIYQQLLQDVSLYLHGTLQPDSTTLQHTEEGKTLEFYLREESSRSVDLLMDHVEQRVRARGGSECVLGAARLLQAVSQLCPNLRKCCSGNVGQEWQAVLDKLDTRSLALWDDWLQHATQHIQHLADRCLLHDVSFCNVLHLLPKWEVIEIEEQVEDKTVKSHIRLPTHPSVSLVTLLSTVLSHLDSVVPHTIPKTIHDRFIDALVTVVFDHYELLSVNENVNQNLAIQLLLDVKLVSMVCVRRDCRALATRTQQISENLRSKVDPFDLNVFYSHLQACIRRAVLQMNVLFGCLLASTSQLSSIGVQEQVQLVGSDRDPSILPYSVPHSEVWFPLLPVTAPVAKSLLCSATVASDGGAKVRARQPSPTRSGSSVRSGAAALLADWFS